jgi:hypothetical protein
VQIHEGRFFMRVQTVKRSPKWADRVERRRGLEFVYQIVCPHLIIMDGELKAEGWRTFGFSARDGQEKREWEEYVAGRNERYEPLDGDVPEDENESGRENEKQLLTKKGSGKLKGKASVQCRFCFTEVRLDTVSLWSQTKEGRKGEKGKVVSHGTATVLTTWKCLSLGQSATDPAWLAHLERPRPLYRKTCPRVDYAEVDGSICRKFEGRELEELTFEIVVSEKERRALVDERLCRYSRPKEEKSNGIVYAEEVGLGVYARTAGRISDEEVGA